MMTKEEIARVAHEVNRAYCRALGDFTQSPWELAPGWQRDSALDGVQFHMDHPDAGPSASHEAWMREKIEDGWVYGPVKLVSVKEHPCLVSFDRLPQEQQVKHYLFKAVVRSLVTE